MSAPAPSKLVVDCETGEVAVVELTGDDLTQWQSDQERGEREARELAERQTLATRLDEIEESEVVKADPDAVLLARIGVARRALSRGQMPADDLLSALGAVLR